MTPHSTTSASAKRPKLHPLRQTSFPANDATNFYTTPSHSARSETGSVANSLVSGLSGQTKRGRGRPRKSDRQSTQLTEEDLDTAQGGDGNSLVNGNGGAGGAGRGTKSVISRRSGDVEPDDDDEGDYGGMVGTMDEQDRERVEEEKRREAQKIDRLTSTFTPEQDRRYNLWRAAKLNKVTVRKIVNQTVSQSVTAVPLQAIQIYSKFFVGEIIERARDVQSEWAQAWDAAKEAEGMTDDEGSTRLQTEDGGRNSIDFSGRAKQAKKYEPNPHKGGLLPDHLREALRRYKGDGEGNGVGFGSMSHALMGVHGAGVWKTGSGRRLFK